MEVPVPVSTDRTQPTFHWFALANVDLLEDTASDKNTTYATGTAMFCNKGTADGKKTLEIRQPATKNYTKQGIHVQLQKIKLNDSKLKKQLDIELSQTKLKLNLKIFFCIHNCLNLKFLQRKLYWVHGVHSTH